MKFDENKKLIAVYADSAFSGLEVYDIRYDIDEYLEIKTYPDKKQHILKIYDANRPYINLYGHRIHLDEMLRTNL